MFSNFKKGHKVFVEGKGKNDGKYYKNKSAIIIERDPYYQDFHVRFEDGTEDWILPKYLRKPYSRKKEQKI